MPGALHLLEHGREHRRRDGEVERGVAADAVAALELGQRRGQLVEGVVVVEGALDEADAAGQLLPDLLAPRRAGVLAGGVAGQLGELRVAPVAAGEAEQREVGGQQAAVGQVVDRRQQLLARQVAGDAEDDQRAGLGHPGQPPVPRIPQRVGGSSSVLEVRQEGPPSGPARTGRRGGQESCGSGFLSSSSLAHRLGELVPGVDELLHALVLEHPEDVVEVDPGVGRRPS